MNVLSFLWTEWIENLILFKNKSYKIFLVRKENVCRSPNILREKVKIHTWNIQVLFSLILMYYICVWVKDLDVSMSLFGRENVFTH